MIKDISRLLEDKGIKNGLYCIIKKLRRDLFCEPKHAWIKIKVHDIVTQLVYQWQKLIFFKLKSCYF